MSREDIKKEAMKKEIGNRFKILAKDDIKSILGES
jgi:hypothetical protein